MQRRRKSTTSVSTHSSSRASRAARLEAVRRASLATYERLENRQMLSTVNPTPVGPGDGWTSAYYNNKGGGSQNAGSADPLNDWLLGNGGMTPTPVFSKITPTINVAGSNPLGPPGVPGFNGGNNYSIRYDGYLLVPNSGTMTFSVGTDDGVQVSIDETTAAAENAATPTAPNWVTVDQQMQIGRGIGNPYNESFVVGSTTLPVNDGTKNAIDNNTNSGAAFSFTAGQLYHVVFTYQNGGGGWGSNFGWSGPASGQANPTIIPKANVYSVLPAVQNVNATAGNGANQVTWTSNVVSDATGGGSIVGPADSFLIERQANFGAFSTLATVTADYSGNNVASFAYNDYTAVDGTTYNYRVTPINGYGTGDSNSSGSVIANDGPIPAPTHVTASRTGTSSVALTWDPGTSASGGYIVSRYATNDGNGNPTGTPVTFNVPVFTAINVPTLATFTDTTAPALAVGQGYFYTVTSLAGAEAPGNVVSNSVASPAVFVGSGDGWDASYYGFRDGQDHHTADDPNALLGFQRVETGPVAIGGPFGANGDNTAPPNSPAQWFATGANQVLANPGSGAGDNFDGRWVGYVQAPVTGYYTFNLGSDDGNNVVYWDAAHLDVNGNPTGVALNNNQIFAGRGIPSPFDVAPVVDTTGAPVLFTAGHKYLIQYEFNNGGGGWGANLMWSAGATSGGTDLMNPEYVPAGDVMAPTPVFKTVYANDVKLTGNTVNDGSILTGTTVTMGSVTKDNAATGFYALHLTTNDAQILAKWNNIGATSYNVYYFDNTANPSVTPTSFTQAGMVQFATGIAGTQGAGLSKLITGLTNGHQYTVYVSGVDQSGESPVASATSAQINVVATVLPAPASASAVIDIPSNDSSAADNPLVLGNTNTQRILISWAAVPFAGSYTIKAFFNGSATASYTLTASAATSSIMDNVPLGTLGVVYKVQAINSSGPGALKATSTLSLTNGVVEAYYNDQWWFANGYQNPGYNNVGVNGNPNGNNLTLQPAVSFDSTGGGGQANPGASLADRSAPHRGGGIGEFYSTVFEGQIVAPVEGDYKFGTFSDDQSALMINGTIVLTQGNCCADLWSGNTGNVANATTIHLTAGQTVSFIFFQSQGGGGHNTDLLWQYQPTDSSGVAQGAVVTRAIIPQSSLLPIDDSNRADGIGFPTAATGAAATYDATPGTIDLTFTDNSINELHYQLLRSTSAAGPFTAIGTASGFTNGSGGSVTLKDATGVLGTTYYYEVAASNLYGTSTSAPSAGITVNYLPPTYFSANPGNSLETVLQWTNATGALASPFVAIEKSTDNGVTWTEFATKSVTPGANDSLRITGQTAGQVTFYRIRGVDNATPALRNVAVASLYARAQASVPVLLPSTPSVIDYSAGFTTNTLSLNGGATVLANGNLQLTDGGPSEGRSAYSNPATNPQVSDTAFTTTFDYTANANANLADGMTFTLQNAGANAVGATGGGKGIGGVTPEISVGLNPFPNVSQGVLYINGNQVGSMDLTAPGAGAPNFSTGQALDLHSGDTFELTISYDSTAATPTFTATITDVTKLTHPSQTIDLQAAINAINAAQAAMMPPGPTIPNIPTLLGSPTAFAGFTGGTGGVQMVQNISNWTYAAGSLAVGGNVTPTVAAFTVPSSVEGTAFASTPVAITGKANDAYSVSVDYGDSTTPAVFTGTFDGSGNASVNIGHTYAEDKAAGYVVTVTATDTTETGSGTVSTPVTSTAAVSGAPLVATITGAPAGAIASGTTVNLGFGWTQPDASEADLGTASYTITGPAGFTTVNGTASTSPGSFSFAPTIAGTYTVTMTASEAGGTDAETGTATPVTITVNAVAPALTSVVLDDGLNTRERSMIRSVTYNFTQPVQAPTAGSVTITQTQNLVSTGTGNTLTTGLNNDFSSALDFAHAVSSNGGATWTVPFLKSVAGKTQASGSLVDGVYSVTMHASLIKDLSNQAVTSGDHVSTFHVLFGDINGTPTTGHFKLTNSDFQKFSATFNLTVGQTGYVPYFHFSGNFSTAAASKISNADFGQFSNRFTFAGFVYTPVL